MRLVVAECAARYTGRLSAHLPKARRLVVVKADGSVLLHSDGGSYKPLNWMSPPCSLAVVPAADHSFKVPKSAPVSQEEALGIIVESTLEWLVREVTGNDGPGRRVE